MATKKTVYLTFAEAMLFHIELMRHWGETRYGVFSRELVESALARPAQAAVYESADLIRQAATLCYGLIKSHPWVGGNKRTALLLTQVFLLHNGMKLIAAPGDSLTMVLAIETGQWELKRLRHGCANELKRRAHKSINACGLLEEKR
ncbi:MAG: type II toxin-antitoxin system death-on-curing family toxin [Acidobacteria bacterium]|nr:type II toxin-antitoxin system death-on-curing family toxin [Acidobacteriota bacterium]